MIWFTEWHSNSVTVTYWVRNKCSLPCSTYLGTGKHTAAAAASQNGALFYRVRLDIVCLFSFIKSAGFHLVSWFLRLSGVEEYLGYIRATKEDSSLEKKRKAPVWHPLLPAPHLSVLAHSTTVRMVAGLGAWHWLIHGRKGCSWKSPKVLAGPNMTP